jgi:Papain-like cysteine protease AvrRpt2
MVAERRPASPLAKNFVPTGLIVPYKVKTGDSWASIATQFNLKPWVLIEFNFPTVSATTDFQRKCEEVNWYMRENIGCSKSSDGKSYSFSSFDQPGLVFIPVLPKPPEIKSYFVPRDLRRVAQPHSNVCWAAAATIMMSWKDKATYTILEAMELAGEEWRDRYKDRKGLPFTPVTKNYRFAADCGMNAAPFPCGDAETWMDLLKAKGPIAVAHYHSTDWDHMVVLYGVFIVNDEATMYVMDPGTGAPEKLKLKTFLKSYSDAFRGSGSKPSIWFYGSKSLPICTGL